MNDKAKGGIPAGVSTLAAVAAALAMAQPTDADLETEDQERKRRSVADAAGYKARNRPIDALRTVRRVAPGPNPAVERVAKRFPYARLVQSAKGWELRQGGTVLGKGSTITRACKAAERANR